MGLVRLYFRSTIMQHYLVFPYSSLDYNYLQNPICRRNSLDECTTLLLALSPRLNSLNEFLFAYNFQRVMLNFIFRFLYFMQSRSSLIVFLLLSRSKRFVRIFPNSKFPCSLWFVCSYIFPLVIYYFTFRLYSLIHFGLLCSL